MSNELSKIQTVELTREQLATLKDPSNYYIVNAFGNRVYIKTTDRAKAQEKADEMYGKGFYKVRTVSDKDDLGKKQWSKPEEYKPVRGVHTKRGQRKPN
jgi:hypothetical protein